MAVTVSFYNHFLELLGDGTLDMDGHSFKIALMDTVHEFDEEDEDWADVSANEIAAGNGYTTNGQVLAGVTWAQTDGTVKFDADNPVWTASGGSIETAYAAVIYDDTTAGDKLICTIDFGAGKAAEDGADLNIIFSETNGIFQIANAA